MMNYGEEDQGEQPNGKKRNRKIHKKIIEEIHMNPLDFWKQVFEVLEDETEINNESTLKSSVHKQMREQLIKNISEIDEIMLKKNLDKLYIKKSLECSRLAFPTLRHSYKELKSPVIAKEEYDYMSVSSLDLNSYINDE